MPTITLKDYIQSLSSKAATCRNDDIVFLDSTTNTLQRATPFSVVRGASTINNNIALGCCTIFAASTSSSGNVAIGANALTCLSVGVQNIGLGIGAGFSLTSGCDNIMIGTSAMGAGTVIGNYNIAIGRLSAPYATTATNNVIVGSCSAGILSTGQSNVAIGSQALCAITTGSCNIAIGMNSGSSVSTASNTITVGSCISAPNTTNHTRWGNALNNVSNCIQSAWVVASDCRDKVNINPLSTKLGLDFVNKLNPVEFNWDSREAYVMVCGFEYGHKDGTLASEQKAYGLIAQELKSVLNEIGVSFDALLYNDDEDAYRIRYEEFIPVLMKAIQELNNRHETEIARINQELESIRSLIQ